MPIDSSQVTESIPSPVTKRVPLAVVVTYEFAKLAFASLLILFLLGLLLEMSLRLAGVKPIPLAAKGLTAIMPDNWTGWRLRPNVVDGQEWVRTNSLSMHENREVSAAKPPGTFRAVVVGSSLVYGLGLNIRDTISSSAERELTTLGAHAQVLNLGVHGFTLSNVSALIQNYVHQLQPDVIVMVVDLNMAEVHWGPINASAINEEPVKKLSWSEALFVRASQVSSVMRCVEDPDVISGWFRRHMPFPFPDSIKTSRQEPLTPAAAVDATPQPPADVVPALDSAREYQERERREVRAILSSIAAFCREMKISLVFVTPYGPYFHYSDKDTIRYGNLAVLQEWSRIYGTRQAALSAEMLLLTDVIRDVGREFGNPIVDMLAASHTATFDDPDFGDSIHLSAIGCSHLGKIIADHIYEIFLRPRNHRSAVAAL